MQFGMDSGLNDFDPFNLNKKKQGQFDSPFQRPYKTTDIQLNPLNPPAPPPSKDTETKPIFSSGLTSLRNMDSPDRQRYREFLQDIPNRNNYQLTKLGKALSGISGVIDAAVSKDVGRGIRTGQSLINKPYEDAINEYSMKGSGLKELAGIEYQNQQDQKDLEVKIAKDQLDRRKQWFDELKGQHDMDLTDAQAWKIIDDAERNDWTLERGTETGKIYKVNKRTGQILEIAKIDESKPETRARDLRDWNIKYDKEQGGREALQRDLFRHQDAFQAQGAKNDQGLAAYKAQLDNMKPEVVDKAWSAAYDRVLAENPDLRNQLFNEAKDKDGNPTGKLILKDAPVMGADGKPVRSARGYVEAYNPEVYNQFIDAVNQKAKESLGLPAFDLKAYNKSREIDPQRESAVTRIQQYNAEHPYAQKEINDENIANVMRQQEQESREFGQQPYKNTFGDLPVNLPDYSLQLNPQLAPSGFQFQNLGQRPQQLPIPTGWWRRGQGGASF